MKDLVYPAIYKEIAQDLGLTEKQVSEAYKSFWQFIKEVIEDLPLKDDLTEEEFNELKKNFNIPSLGKLNCTYDRYSRMKRRYNIYKKLKDGRV